MLQRTLIATAGFVFLAGSAAWAADGATIYKDNCAQCHGETGKSDTPISQAMKVPALAGDANVQKMSDADIATRIKENAKHPPKIKTLSDADIDAAATFVKQLAGSPGK